MKKWCDNQCVYWKASQNILINTGKSQKKYFFQIQETEAVQVLHSQHMEHCKSSNLNTPACTGLKINQFGHRIKIQV